MNFCSHCGAAVNYRIPDGDDLPRFVCDRCGMIHYDNPKMVVGCIPEWEDKILLCRRAIAPRSGKWTLPAGYLENGESVTEGAIRETREEAAASVEVIAPYAVMSLAFINQVYLLFRARLLNTAFRPGDETAEVRLFTEAELPWEDIAFGVIQETLVRYFKDKPSGVFPVHTVRINPSGGSSWP